MKKKRMEKNKTKIKVSRAIIVEGRDDVAKVSEACDALIIPTHGYGIAAETWSLIEKAYTDKGILILTGLRITEVRMILRCWNEWRRGICLTECL